MSKLSPAQWLARLELRRLAWGGSTLAVALVLGAAVAAAVLWRDMVRESEAEVERTVRLLSEHAARVIEPVDHTLREVGAALQSQGFGRAPLDPQHLHELVRPCASVGPYLLRVLVLDRTGRVMGLSDQPHPPGDVRYDDPWFRELASGKRTGLVVGTPQDSRLGTQQIVSVARAIVDDGTGEFLGVAAAALSLDELGAFHRNVRLAPGWHLALLRDDGTPITGSGPGTLAGPVADGAIADLVPPADDLELAQWRPAGARETMFAVHRVRPWPLLAAVTVDASTVIEPWRRRAMLMASITAPAALGVLAITGLASAAAWRSRNLARTLDLTDARYRALVESSPDGIVVSRTAASSTSMPPCCGWRAATGPPLFEDNAWTGCSKAPARPMQASSSMGRRRHGPPRPSTGCAPAMGRSSKWRP